MKRSIAKRIAVAVLAACAAPLAATAQDGPAEAGLWKGPYDTPVVGIHSVVLPNGRILQWSYPVFDPEVTHAVVLDPRAKEARFAPLDVFAFCGGQSVLPSGHVLVGGGSLVIDDVTRGLPTTRLFDPSTETWHAFPDMLLGRYYPTQLSLGEGRTLSLSGLDQFGRSNPLVEAFGALGRWGLLLGAEAALDLYPFVHLLSNGDVFVAGPGNLSLALDVGARRWRPVAFTLSPDRHHGTSVLVPGARDRVMLVGGGSPPTAACETIDVRTDGGPSHFEPTGSLHVPRSHPNVVILPDSTILAVGGETPDGGAAMAAEIYDPATGTWRLAAAMRVPRTYHSTAVLLPDGSVLASGSDLEFRSEIYRPPYFFRGARPRLASAPDAAAWGETIAVGTPDAARIASVAFVRPAATTHSVNADQRLVPATFAAAPGGLSIDVPADPNELPPGFYMLFIVDSAGRPSRAKFVRVGS